MGHDHHFLSRLDRVRTEHVDLALGRYVVRHALSLECMSVHAASNYIDWHTLLARVYDIDSLKCPKQLLAARRGS